MKPPSTQTPLFGSAGARRLAWLCGTLLVLAGLAVNARSIDFGFLYLRDDDVNVALNPHMGVLGADRLRWMFTDTSLVRRYIPLGWLGFSTTFEFSGLNPAGYHAVALGLYCVNAALVFAIVLRVLRLFAPGGRPAGLGGWDVGAAALAAGWWTLHPLRVETTAWISGNLYGQAAALLLASLLAYLRTYDAAGGRRAAWLALSALAYAASLLTYPVALGVPFLLIGLDWLRAGGRPGAFARLLAEKAVFLVPLAAMLAVTVAARYGNTTVWGAVPGIGELPLSSRVAQAAYIAAYFVWKPWWPTHLSPLYDTLFDFRATNPAFVFSLAAVLAVSGWALASLRRRPAVAAVWFGYLAAAAPFFGLTEKPHMPSDRYGYFLTVISAAVVAVVLARIAGPRARACAAVGSLAVIALLARLSWRQLDVWTDDRAQHAYVAAHLVNPVLLEDFTSRRLILDFLRGDEKAAADSIAEHLQADPENPGFQRAATIVADKKRIGAFYGPVIYLAILHERLGLGFADAGDLRDADLHLEEALRLDGRFYQAAYDRALILLRMGRCEDALRNFLWSAGWAPQGLPAPQRREFLDRLAREADAEGKPLLASSARGALAR